VSLSLEIRPSRRSLRSQGTGGNIDPLDGLGGSILSGSESRANAHWDSLGTWELPSISAPIAGRDPPADQGPGSWTGASGVHEAACFIRDEILFEAIDKPAATVLALVVLFAVVNVTVFLVFGGLASWADVADDHRHG
jgi:hypothetical protein